MKLKFTLYFLSALFLCSSGMLFPQSLVEVKWACDTSAGVKPIINGSVSAFDEKLANLEITDYKGPNGSQRTQPPGGVWPADVVQDTTRFIEFKISALPGTVLSISTIELNIGSSGGSNMNAYAAYSTDDGFRNPVKVFQEQMGKNTIQLVTLSPNLSIEGGSSLYIRCYPWYAKGSSSGKYLCLSNVVVKGASGLKGLPLLTTSPVSAVLINSAKCGGNVTDDGGEAVTSRGVCWSVQQNPTINDNKTVDGAGKGIFTSSLNNLTAGTTYYVKAYASNKNGITYGEEKVFKTLTAGTKYKLSLNTIGAGSILATPAGELYEPGASVTLKALPDAGNEFMKWSGSISGNTNPFILTMDGDKTIGAQFVDAQLLIPEKAPIGFAAASGAGLNITTGGAGGDTVYCKEGEAITSYINGQPRTIVVEGVVTGGEIKGYKNITILGKGKNAALHSLAITNSSNIIIRNITVFDSPDGIRITTTSSNTTHHIWIDHCTFTDSPAIDLEGNSHDGLLDITHRSSYITVSWCRFYNHRKTCLLGYSASATDEREPNQLMVTYHHNWFDSTNSRHPRVRWAPVHVYNNVYSNNPGYGIGSTCGAKVFVEANYFENVKYPVLISKVNDSTEVLSGDPIGYVKEKNNYTLNSGTVAQYFDSTFTFEPSSFYSYTADSAKNIADIVKTFAGAGKLKFLETSGVVGVIGETNIVKDFNLCQNYPNPFNPVTNISFTIPAEMLVTLKIYDVLGREICTPVHEILKAGSHNHQLNMGLFASGVYYYKLNAGSFHSVKKMTLVK